MKEQIVKELIKLNFNRAVDSLHVDLTADKPLTVITTNFNEFKVFNCTQRELELLYKVNYNPITVIKG